MTPIEWIVFIKRRTNNGLNRANAPAADQSTCQQSPMELGELLLITRPKDHMKFIRDVIYCANFRKDKQRVVFMAPDSFDHDEFAKKVAKSLHLERIFREGLEEPDETKFEEEWERGVSDKTGKKPGSSKAVHGTSFGSTGEKSGLTGVGTSKSTGEQISAKFSERTVDDPCPDVDEVLSHIGRYGIGKRRGDRLKPGVDSRAGKPSFESKLGDRFVEISGQEEGGDSSEAAGALSSEPGEGTGVEVRSTIEKITLKEDKKEETGYLSPKELHHPIASQKSKLDIRVGKKTGDEDSSAESSPDEIDIFNPILIGVVKCECGARKKPKKRRKSTGSLTSGKSSDVHGLDEEKDRPGKKTKGGPESGSEITEDEGESVFTIDGRGEQPVDDEGGKRSKRPKKDEVGKDMKPKEKKDGKGDKDKTKDKEGKEKDGKGGGGKGADGKERDGTGRDDGKGKTKIGKGEPEKEEVKDKDKGKVDKERSDKDEIDERKRKGEETGDKDKFGKDKKGKDESKGKEGKEKEGKEKDGKGRGGKGDDGKERDGTGRDDGKGKEKVGKGEPEKEKDKGKVDKERSDKDQADKDEVDERKRKGEETGDKDKVGKDKDAKRKEGEVDGDGYKDEDKGQAQAQAEDEVTKKDDKGRDGDQDEKEGRDRDKDQNKNRDQDKDQDRDRGDKEKEGGDKDKDKERGGKEKEHKEDQKQDDKKGLKEEKGKEGKELQDDKDREKEKERRGKGDEDIGKEGPGKDDKGKKNKEQDAAGQDEKGKGKPDADAEAEDKETGDKISKGPGGTDEQGRKSVSEKGADKKKPGEGKGKGKGEGEKGERDTEERGRDKRDDEYEDFGPRRRGTGKGDADKGLGSKEGKGMSDVFEKAKEFDDEGKRKEKKDGSSEGSKPGGLEEDLGGLKREKELRISKSSLPCDTGWIMVDLPKNGKEAELMSRLGITPTHAIKFITNDSQEKDREYQDNVRTWSAAYKSVPVTEIVVNNRKPKQIARDIIKLLEIMPHRHAPMLPRIVIIGSRGSGSSTQAKMLAEKLKLVHVDYEELLAQALLDESELGRMYQMQAATTVVDPEVEALILERKLLSWDCLNHGYVLTNYPNNSTQMRMLDLVTTPPNRTIFMDVPPKECFLRIHYRKIDPCIGEVYRPPNIIPDGLATYFTEGISPRTERRLLSYPQDHLRQAVHDIEDFFNEKKAIKKYLGRTATYVNGDKNLSKVFEVVIQIVMNPSLPYPARNPLVNSPYIVEAYEKFKRLRKSFRIGTT